MLLAVRHAVVQMRAGRPRWSLLALAKQIQQIGYRDDARERAVVRDDDTADAAAPHEIRHTPDGVVVGDRRDIRVHEILDLPSLIRRVR